MVLELEQRTRLHFEDTEHTVLDYVCEWHASGKTMRALAAEITDDTGLEPPLEGRAIQSYLFRAFDKREVQDRIADAREIGAHVMVEMALDDAETLTDKDQAPIVRVRNDARFWTAARYNKRELGDQKNIGVTINVQTLHLDALRQRNAERVKAQALESDAHARSLAESAAVPAIAGAIDIEYEVVSDDSATS